MGRSKIKNIFQSIAQLSEEESFEFYAERIPGSKHHRIAKDTEGNPVLLIRNKSHDKPNTFLPTIKLRHIIVEFNIKCRIKDGTRTSINTFSVIRFVSQEASLREYFFTLVDGIINELGESPSQNAINASIKSLIEILKFAVEVPKTTIQGLWAELFLISVQTKPIELLRCWHSTIDEKFDFSSEEGRLEVKSCVSNSRVHHFSVQQLNPPDTVSGFVVSIIVSRATKGLSVWDLEKRISRKLVGKSTEASKLRYLILETLGVNYETANMRFDPFSAAESIRFVRMKDVPKIDLSNVPPLVSEVRFMSNLDTCKSINLEIAMREFFSIS